MAKLADPVPGSPALEAPPKKKPDMPAPAKDAPPPAADGDEVALLRKQVAELKEALFGRHRDEQAAQKRLQDMEAELGQPAHVRTQKAMSRQYPPDEGDKLFRVQLPENPAIEVHAHSSHEAVGRYFEICGIRQSDHQPTVHELASAETAAA